MLRKLTQKRHTYRLYGAQALLERFPAECSDARWQQLRSFLAVSPDVRRLNKALGGRMLDFDPADGVTPRRVRDWCSRCCWREGARVDAVARHQLRGWRCCFASLGRLVEDVHRR